MIIPKFQTEKEEADWLFEHRAELESEVRTRMMNHRRVKELLDQFEIQDTDELKHILEDHARWKKEIVELSVYNQKAAAIIEDLCVQVLRFAVDIDIQAAEEFLRSRKSR